MFFAIIIIFDRIHVYRCRFELQLRHDLFSFSFSSSVEQQLTTTAFPLFNQFRPTIKSFRSLPFSLSLSLTHTYGNI
jgi:hypothetical protein